MKTEPSLAERSLRSASLVITLLSVLVFSTIAYSAYADANGVLKVFGAGSSSSTAPVSVTSTTQGNTTDLTFNVTLQNNGLYPIEVSGSCASTPGGLNATCNMPTTTIGPGQSTSFQFTLGVVGLSVQGAAGNEPLYVDFKVALEPFVSVSVTANLSSFIGGGTSQ
jgi:hypothetical protein